MRRTITVAARTQSVRLVQGIRVEKVAVHGVCQSSLVRVRKADEGAGVGSIECK
jgi:hypothetical protein